MNKHLGQFRTHLRRALSKVSAQTYTSKSKPGQQIWVGLSNSWHLTKPNHQASIFEPYSFAQNGLSNPVNHPMSPRRVVRRVSRLEASFEFPRMHVSQTDSAANNATCPRQASITFRSFLGMPKARDGHLSRFAIPSRVKLVTQNLGTRTPSKESPQPWGSQRSSQVCLHLLAILFLRSVMGVSQISSFFFSGKQQTAETMASRVIPLHRVEETKEEDPNPSSADFVIFETAPHFLSAFARTKR